MTRCFNALFVPESLSNSVTVVKVLTETMSFSWTCPTSIQSQGRVRATSQSQHRTMSQLEHSRQTLGGKTTRQKRACKNVTDIRLERFSHKYVRLSACYTSLGKNILTLKHWSSLSCQSTNWQSFNQDIISINDTKTCNKYEQTK